MGIACADVARSDVGEVSIQLISPTSGDMAEDPEGELDGEEVSIQLISPTSGDEKGVKQTTALRNNVSIQLISPTSGDPCDPKRYLLGWVDCFHSINIPNEWG